MHSTRWTSKIQTASSPRLPLDKSWLRAPGRASFNSRWSSIS